MQIDLPSGRFSLDRVQVMGILNRTPDSFYDGGEYLSLEAAVRHARQMAADGAGLIDVGGEKAGPGDPVSVSEEIRRVIPVVEALHSDLSVPISIDTFKPDVAKAAVAAGAAIINSISGLADPALRRVAAESGAAVVIMHIQGRPRVANPRPRYRDVVADVREFLERRARECVMEGIPAERIIIDPGPGFGKTTEHDLEVLRHLAQLTTLPYPVLLAASRKKFLGDLLGANVTERLEASLAVVAWGVMQGVKIVRVHDVRSTRRVVAMTEAVLHPETIET